MHHIKYFGADHFLQDLNMPNYYQMLRLQDLEEIIDEEYVYIDEFESKNMTGENLTRALRVLNDKLDNEGADDEQRHFAGEPYYQPHKNFTEWLNFNTTNAKEEKSIKLLLNMPLIP